MNKFLNEQGLLHFWERTRLPIRFEVVETICENVELSDANREYIFPEPIVLDSSSLYSLAYFEITKAYMDIAISKVITDPENNSYVRWIDSVETNSVTMRADKLVDNWLGSGKNVKIKIDKLRIVYDNSAIYSIDEMKNILFGDNIASGINSHTEGKQTTASGFYSHAEGKQTIASGGYSHSEGYNTVASGGYSHAGGSDAIASGKNSFAHGITVTTQDGQLLSVEASGIGSVAFGLGTKASQTGSFAEGERTISSGISSHAEGNVTTASGSASHSEGVSTTASGKYSHAEGFSATASGAGSHAGGVRAIASGSYSFAHGGYVSSAEGEETIYTEASKYSAFAMGISARAIEEGAFAQGTKTTASGKYSHAEGQLTTASGQASHAEGQNSVAGGGGSHAEGASTTASGNFSHAEGHKTTVTEVGEASHAEGRETTVSGKYSHAEGYRSTASGYISHAEGQSTKATGSNSHAEGNRTIAGSTASHAEGEDTEANGYASHAEGQQSIASGGSAHAEGKKTMASGERSHAEGGWTKASGDNSHAGGSYTIASAFAQTAIGYGNVEYAGASASSKNTNAIFMVGKGSNTARSNAFRVGHEGVFGATYYSSGADYAEFFEWADGNVKGEDRTGRFVTLDGDKIRLATFEDEFILGVVSGNPSIIGDGHEDQWRDMYLCDIYGRTIYADVEIQKELDEEGNVIQEAHIEYLPKINPNYDNTKTYVPRSERSEWSPVGMMGKLVVEDDGSCIPNGYCSPHENGIAVAWTSRTRYRVMKRIDKHHVQILVI